MTDGNMNEEAGVRTAEAQPSSGAASGYAPKACRHIKNDFKIDVTATGPNTGLPPWIVLCEDCAAAAKTALEREVKRISDAHPSGKSGRAQTWAWMRRVLQDIGA